MDSELHALKIVLALVISTAVFALLTVSIWTSDFSFASKCALQAIVVALVGRSIGGLIYSASALSRATRVDRHRRRHERRPPV